MRERIVQQRSSQLTGSSVALAFTSNIAVGRKVIVMIEAWADTPGASHVTDNLGNTYVRDVLAPTTQTLRGAIYYSDITVGGACTITCNTGVAGDKTLFIFEVEGLATGGANQSASNAAAASTTHSTGTTSTTTTSYQMAFAVDGHEGTTTTMDGVSDDYVAKEVQASATRVPGATAVKTLRGTQATSTTFTWGATGAYAAAVATYACSGAAPATPVEGYTLSGIYMGMPGRLQCGASADAATAGRWWLVNPQGSGVLLRLRLVEYQAKIAGTAVYATSPRLQVERIRFHGTSSGATVAPSKRATSDASATAILTTANTGLNIYGQVPIFALLPPVNLATTAGTPRVVGLSSSEYAPPTDEMITLEPGEAFMLRQADAGSASDARQYVTNIVWEEWTPGTGSSHSGSLAAVGAAAIALIAQVIRRGSPATTGKGAGSLAGRLLLQGAASTSGKGVAEPKGARSTQGSMGAQGRGALSPAGARASRGNAVSQGAGSAGQTVRLQGAGSPQSGGRGIGASSGRVGSVGQASAQGKGSAQVGAGMKVGSPISSQGRGSAAIVVGAKLGAVAQALGRGVGSVLGRLGASGQVSSQGRGRMEAQGSTQSAGVVTGEVTTAGRGYVLVVGANQVRGQATAQGTSGEAVLGYLSALGSASSQGRGSLAWAGVKVIVTGGPIGSSGRAQVGAASQRGVAARATSQGAGAWATTGRVSVRSLAQAVGRAIALVLGQTASGGPPQEPVSEYRSTAPYKGAQSSSAGYGAHQSSAGYEGGTSTSQGYRSGYSSSAPYED